MTASSVGLQPPTSELAFLSAPAIAVHGGAGAFERLCQGGAAVRAEILAGLGQALDAGSAVLRDGGTALTAAVEAVAALEDSGAFNAGRGSVPNTAGELETDASVMDGASGAAGGVCAASWPANPVRAALLVARLCSPGEQPQAEASPAFRPLLLAGRGADRLAESAGLVRMGDRRPPNGGVAEGSRAGTVGAVALDAQGHVAAATSTGGRAGQPLGRVGDSPIIGAGTWADDASAAVSGTGVGEAFVLAGFAHRVDWAMRSGTALDEAMLAALWSVFERGGTGGGIALSPEGHLSVVFNTPAMARAWWHSVSRVVRV